MKILGNILIYIILANSVNIELYTPSKLDSMIAHFKNIDDDSLKLLQLYRIRDTISVMDKDTALTILDNLGTYCEKTEYYIGAGICFYRQGRDLRRSGDYYKSYLAYQKSLKNYELIENLSGEAAAYNGLANLYKDLNQTQKSFDAYIQSAQIFHNIRDTVWEGSIYLNLGGMLEEQDSLELAKFYLKKSEQILNKVNHRNLLNCYINLGIVFEKEAEYDSAHYYFEHSYKRSLYEGDKGDQFNGLYYLGKFYLEQGNLSDAELLLEQARLLSVNPDTKNELSVIDWADLTNVLGHFYAIKEDYAKAYYYLRESFNYEAKFKLREANRELSRIDFEKLELEAKLKENRRELVIIISMAVILFSLVFLFLLYRSYKHKQKANQLLTEMDELKTQLYSDISHELRTPLTLILGPLEQMLASEAQKTPTRRQIKLMRKNANSILKLVNQMLDLSKIDAKSLKLELSECDVTKFLKVRFANFASLAEQKNISFNRYLPPDKKIRFFDKSKLEKITNNLLSNAIKFTPKGGQIFCFASFPKNNRLELTIQDTGHGIPEDELSRIFDRFHQLSSNHSNNNIGTGIGLSLTKELVELMHGTINVESVVGEGTKFKVQLPLGKEYLAKDEYVIIEKEIATSVIPITDDIDEPSDECNNKTATQNNDNLPNILVVDDHPEISDFIKENLSSCYLVDTAENGLVGLNKAIESIPDLIISDLMMPEMDGIEMSKKLKSDTRTSHIPIIILTAKSKIDDKLQGLETGADAFLAKPFNMKELGLRVRKLIEQRKKLRERFTKNLHLEPKDIAVTSVDEKFLLRIMEIIEENISNSEFEVRHLQEEMLMSRMQIFRKIKALTNQTPGEFIRTIRLKRAARLLEQNFGNIAQITYEVGFNNPSYFAKCFKDLFGKLPSEYIKHL